MYRSFMRCGCGSALPVIELERVFDVPRFDFEHVADIMVVVEAEGKQNIIEKDIIDTGATLNSMQTVMAGDEAHIGPTTDYAIYHEMGTSRMAARPFLRPALAENKDAILRAVADAVRAQIRGRR